MRWHWDASLCRYMGVCEMLVCEKKKLCGENFSSSLIVHTFSNFLWGNYSKSFKLHCHISLSNTVTAGLKLLSCICHQSPRFLIPTTKFRYYLLSLDSLQEQRLWPGTYSARFYFATHWCYFILFFYFSFFLFFTRTSLLIHYPLFLL